MVEGSTQKLYRNPKKNRKKREQSCRVSWTDMIRTRATHKALRRKKLQPPAPTAICLYVCLLLVCDRSLKEENIDARSPCHQQHPCPPPSPCSPQTLPPALTTTELGSCPVALNYYYFIGFFSSINIPSIPDSSHNQSITKYFLDPVIHPTPLCTFVSAASSPASAAAAASAGC